KCDIGKRRYTAISTAIPAIPGPTSSNHEKRPAGGFQTEAIRITVSTASRTSGSLACSSVPRRGVGRNPADSDDTARSVPDHRLVRTSARCMSTAVEHTHHTFCRICEALCGLEVTTVDGRIQSIRPDAAHVATDGFSCVKGLKQHKLYDSPDRLLHPLQRTESGDYQRASWDRALAGIGSKVAQLRRDHGPDSIAMYVGTAA